MSAGKGGRIRRTGSRGDPAEVPRLLGDTPGRHGTIPHVEVMAWVACSSPPIHRRWLILALALTCACARKVAVVDLPPPAPTSDSVTAVAPPHVPTITVAAKKGRTYANIRLAPDSQSPVIAKVPVGTVLKTFGSDGEWFQVQVPSTGALGWIRSVYLE